MGGQDPAVPDAELRGVTLLRRGIGQFRARQLEQALSSLIEAESLLGAVPARRLNARAERAVVLAELGRDAEALELLDVVLFDLRADTPGLDELAYSLLALQVTLAERLQREEQVQAAATAFLDRLGPGVSQNQRTCIALTLVRRGRVAYVMGRWEEARADVADALERLEALSEADAPGAAVTATWLAEEIAGAPPGSDVVVRRGRTRAQHRRIHWLIQQGELDALAVLTPGLVAQLRRESDGDVAAALRDSLVDIYGALVAAEQLDDGLTVLDALVDVLAGSEDPLSRGRATVLLAIKSLLLRSAGRIAEADDLIDAWRSGVGPETWQAHADMLERSCALDDVIRAQQRAGSLLTRAMMLDELDRRAEADAQLAAFAQHFGPEQRVAVAPFAEVAGAARRALAVGGRVADVMAGV